LESLRARHSAESWESILYMDQYTRFAHLFSVTSFYSNQVEFEPKKSALLWLAKKLADEITDRHLNFGERTNSYYSSRVLHHNLIAIHLSSFVNSAVEDQGIKIWDILRSWVWKRCINSSNAESDFINDLVCNWLSLPLHGWGLLRGEYDHMSHSVPTFILDKFAITTLLNSASTLQLSPISCIGSAHSRKSLSLSNHHTFSVSAISTNVSFPRCALSSSPFPELQVHEWRSLGIIHGQYSALVSSQKKAKSARSKEDGVAESDWLLIECWNKAVERGSSPSSTEEEKKSVKDLEHFVKSRTNPYTGKQIP